MPNILGLESLVFWVDPPCFFEALQCNTGNLVQASIATPLHCSRPRTIESESGGDLRKADQQQGQPLQLHTRMSNHAMLATLMP